MSICRMCEIEGLSMYFFETEYCYVVQAGLELEM
jgi:hypothetical protein